MKNLCMYNKIICSFSCKTQKCFSWGKVFSFAQIFLTNLFFFPYLNHALTFLEWDAPFHHIIYDYSCADCNGLCDHLRDIPWVDIFQLSGSHVASEFYQWIQAGIDGYFTHCKYQVKPHLSPWFSAACAAAIVHKNHFLHLYQLNKFSEIKVKFRQASNHCKRVLEAAKLAYANKIRVCHFPETWLLGLLANC